MGMPLELNTMIVTKGNERRVNDNTFTLEKGGYRLYPLEIPIGVYKTRDGDCNGTAIIQKLEMESGKTILTYELVKLNSTQ